MVAQCRIDRHPNTIRIAKHIVVPETDDAIPFTFQDRSSGRIANRFVLPTIDLNDDFRSMTCEVREEVPDRNLPSEMMFAESLAQNSPKTAFCGGRV